MPHAIEHSERACGPQNSHILNKLSDAYGVALSLASWGCVIESITSSQGKPHIWLIPTGACWQLENYKLMQGVDRKGRYTIHAADVNGVDVKWKVRRQQ